jgi:tryptophanyl-tRNA synthetase
VIFLQSSVPEHAELHLLLSMITPLGWLERVPTYKEQIENIKGKDLHTYGFLGYPVLQTADIVIYGEPGMSLAVPVGEDQVAHVELSREIVRSFDVHFGFAVYDSLKNDADALSAIISRVSLKEIATGSNDAWAHMKASIRHHAQMVGIANFLAEFDSPSLSQGDSGHKSLDREFEMPLRSEWKKYFYVDMLLNEPDVMLTQAKRVPGLDGRKMSKSYGNAIELGESDESIRVKTKAMITDPARKRRTDPGNPDICPVYDWHKLFSPAETLSWASVGCKTAGIGCIECKSAMADNLIKWIAPIRARRLEFAAEPKRVLELIDAGSKRARETAQATMARVREAVFGWQAKRESISSSAGTSDAKQRGAGE